MSSETKTPARYVVVPRYTDGAAGPVDRLTAERVAEEEQDAHEEALAGEHGREAQERAARMGLQGVAWEVWEAEGIRFCRDLITFERWAEPAPQAAA
jgi:short subunit dehydrogenase-like uncharacterized protein